MPINWTRKECPVEFEDLRTEETHSAKKQVTDQGGKIINEFKLVKGFTYVSIPLPC